MIQHGSGNGRAGRQVWECLQRASELGCAGVEGAAGITRCEVRVQFALGNGIERTIEACRNERLGFGVGKSHISSSSRMPSGDTP